MSTKASHIKNCNATGFVVKRAAQPDMPFFKLPEALKYCEMMEIPDDAEHLILDPANARSLAVLMLHNAEYERKLLEKRWKKVHEELAALNEKWDNKMNPKNVMEWVDRELLVEDIQKHIGRVEGMYDAMKTLDDRRMELWNITRLNARPNV